MPTPRALSNEGREGSGLAQILPNSAPNPFEVYYRKQAMQGAQQKANLDAKQKQNDSDQKLLDNLSKAGEDILSYDQKAISDKINQTYDKAKSIVSGGGYLTGNPEFARDSQQLVNLQRASKDDAERLNKVLNATDADFEDTDLTQLKTDYLKHYTDNAIGARGNFGFNNPVYFKKNQALGKLLEKFQNQYKQDKLSGNWTSNGWLDRTDTGEMRFMMRDANGNEVPGVSEDTLDTFLSDDRYRTRLAYEADEMLATEAQKLKNEGDTRTIEKIKDDISSLPQYGGQLGMNGLVRKLMRRDLESRQSVSNTTKIDRDTRLTEQANELEYLRGKDNQQKDDALAYRETFQKSTAGDPAAQKTMVSNFEDAVELADPVTGEIKRVKVLDMASNGNATGGLKNNKGLKDGYGYYRVQELDDKGKPTGKINVWGWDNTNDNFYAITKNIASQQPRESSMKYTDADGNEISKKRKTYWGSLNSEEVDRVDSELGGKTDIKTYNKKTPVQGTINTNNKKYQNTQTQPTKKTDTPKKKLY